MAEQETFDRIIDNIKYLQTDTKPMKKFLLTILFVSFLFFTGISQDASQEKKKRIYVNGVYTTLIESPGYYKETSFDDSYWNMDADWKWGIVYTSRGNPINGLALRYNLSRDRFEALKDYDDKIYIVNPDSILKIKRMDEVFVFSVYDDGSGKPAKGYFKVIIDGNTKLLFKKREEHKYGKKGAFGYDAYKVYIPEYYIKKGDSIAQKTKLNKKHILESLSDERNAIEVYSEKNKLHYSREKDLAVILAYYDSLKTHQ